VTELVTVYPAVPPKSQGYSSPGSILVTYEIPEDEVFIRGYFSFTLRAAVLEDGTKVMGTMDQAIQMAQDMLRSHLIGEIEISPECLWRDPADQRQAPPPPPQRQQSAPPPSNDNEAGQNAGNGTPGMFVNHGYKIKRILDEGKVSYVIAFKMANGKESDFPATISNEKYLKMLAKALADAGYKSAEWVSGEPHMINIEFGVTKSEKTAANGKKFNNYQYFKVIDSESGAAKPF
jgi:hypothetical protein